ncbi:MAG: MBL fold metallo-hydrolase [Synergistaceae bacterium]|jgi:glyoxylase-like metal-dependent hydrolase (beta-lactamase superfamily II)|nr:MBL fold metallo-hydrolase [Synergistaceae bacterium]
MKIKRFALGSLWTNCYVIWDSNGDGFIVDPGGPASEVEEYIKNNDILVHWILLTHGHADHIGGVQELRNLSEKGVAIHYEDASCLSDPNKNLSSFLEEIIKIHAAEKELKENDILNVGTMKIEVIHTPGHTPGCICLLVTDGEEQLLLSGDTLFARSIGRSDLPGGNETVLLNSLKKLEHFPDKLKVYPGHGPETTIGTEKEHNPYWVR